MLSIPARSLINSFRLRTSRKTSPITHIQALLRWQSSSSSSGEGGLQWSYVSNPGECWLRGDTIGQVVTRAADRYGDREALVSVYQDTRKTFTQVNQESDGVAAGLLALGLQPGDKIGMWGPNSYEWYLTQMSVAKAGLIMVNINPAYRPKELEYSLNKVEVKALICNEKFKTTNYYEMLCAMAPELPTSRGELKSPTLPHLKTVIIISDTQFSGTYRFKDIAEAADTSHMKALEELSSKIKFDDPCSIQFTSGTTGSPKAAVLSHHMLVNNAYNIGRRGLYGQEIHRICLPLPLFHCVGCVCGTLMAALHGSTCVLPSPGYDPETILQAFQDERITSCFGTPTVFIDILKAQKKKPRDVSSLSTGMMAGAPCPQELILDVIKEFNVKDIMVIYGMTETSSVTFQCFPSDTKEIYSSTIGYPADHTEVKVTDKTGQVVAVGKPGELCIRGYLTFLGYWGDPDKTKEMMGPDGWLKTGDLAVLRPDGYGQIVGRITDMIIRGGENIYPAEMENFLMGHPDINEAQVFSVPDERMGQEVAVWIKRRDNSGLDESAIRAWCKDKVAHYKVPRYILFKAEFPTTVTGKNQKFKMKEITVRELNLK